MTSRIREHLGSPRRIAVVACASALAFGLLMGGASPATAQSGADSANAANQASASQSSAQTANRRQRMNRQVRRLGNRVQRAIRVGRRALNVANEALELAQQGGQGGPAGPAGPAGPQGQQGPQGPPGQNGQPGQPGADGDDGESVTSELEPPGANCAQGGSKFTDGDGEVTYACNGANGAPGPPGADGEDGDPWTEFGTLPPDATMTGTYTFNGTDADILGVIVGISFPIPLAAPLGADNVHLIEPGGTVPDECDGGTPENPQADSGHLCVFEIARAASSPASPVPLQLDLATPGASGPGALIPFAITGPVGFGLGSWAVTG